MQTIQGHKKVKNRKHNKNATSIQSKPSVPTTIEVAPPKEERDILLCIAVALLFVYVLANIFIGSVVFFYTFPEQYAWSELMINYQAGFIRRGLIGDILWQTKEVFDFRFTAMLLVLMCLIVFYILMYKKLINAYDKYLVFFLCASPTLLIFLPVNLAELFRKDIFILTALLLQFDFISQYIQQKISTYKVYTFVLILFLVGTLIHEILIFFTLLPALLLWQEECKRGRGAFAFIGIGVVLATVTLFIGMHLGTREQAEIIAQSWESLLELPQGLLISKNYALEWFGTDIHYLWNEMSLGRALWLGAFYTTIAFFLGALPLIVVYYAYDFKGSIKNYFTIPYYPFFLIFALIFPFCLFIMLLDHGRVVFFTMSYYLFFFITMQEISPKKKRVEYITFINHLLQNCKFYCFILCLVLLYACTWRVVTYRHEHILQVSMPMKALLISLDIFPCSLPPQ
ncbi:MAG: hypothetical protein R3Y11_02560 [Pseudomonadota bacterium]